MKIKKALKYVERNPIFRAVYIQDLHKGTCFYIKSQIFVDFICELHLNFANPIYFKTAISLEWEKVL